MVRLRPKFVRGLIENYEAILAEIGTRVSNTRNYADAFKRAGKNTSEVPMFAEFEGESFAP